MITTVVTAFPVCMCTIFPCFSKKKKIIVQEKKNVATKTEKREISYFSAKKSPSKTRKLRVECKTNTPDPVDQNELHRLNSHYFHVSAHLAFYRQI